jgi:hypothetical protein
MIERIRKEEVMPDRRVSRWGSVVEHPSRG